jgi:hypothetical protein
MSQHRTVSKGESSEGVKLNEAWADLVGLNPGPVEH